MNENTQTREAPHSLEISVGSKGQVTATIKQYVADASDLDAALANAARLLSDAAGLFPTFVLDGSLAAVVDAARAAGYLPKPAPSVWDAPMKRDRTNEEI